MATPVQINPSQNELLRNLQQGVKAWNEWRSQNPGVPLLLNATDLSNRDFSDRDLSGADFQNTTLAGTNLQGADLTRANLSKATLRGADLSKANLPEANMQVNDLSLATLQYANLRGAKLQRVVFDKVDLLQADMREANLQGADLSGVKAGMLPWQLAGTNLTGATLPKPLETLYEKLGMVSEISDSAKKLFLALLAACLYSWLTIGTTKDVDLITNRASSPLPIIQTAIPIVGFYVVAPMILLCVYFYFHFYLQKLWEELAQLPAIFPDGKPLHQRADPWLFNDLVRAHFSKLRKDRPFLSKFQHVVSIFLAWWLVPITLLLFWARYVPRHDTTWSQVLGAILSLSIVSAIHLYRLAKETLRGFERSVFTLRRVLAIRRTYTDALRAVIISASLILASSQAITRVEGSHLRPVPQGTWVQRAMQKLGYSPFANLSNSDVSHKPPNWTGKKDEELALVQGADLHDQDLTRIDGEGAFLVKANLSQADLTGAYLASADLRQANLSGANLQNVRLFRADFTNANLAYANFDSAWVASSDFTGADLTGANLQDVTFTFFSGPQGTWIFNKLRYTKLQHTGLLNRSTRTISQIKKCTDWDMAFYDDDILKQLGLPPDHNDALQAHQDSKSQEPFDDAWIQKWRKEKAKAENKTKSK